MEKKSILVAGIRYLAILCLGVILGHSFENDAKELKKEHVSVVSVAPQHAKTLVIEATLPERREVEKSVEPTEISVKGELVVTLTEACHEFRNEPSARRKAPVRNITVARTDPQSGDEHINTS